MLTQTPCSTNWREFNTGLPGAGRDELVIGADGVLNGFGPARLDGAC